MNTFETMVREIRGGASARELSEKLAELVAQVKATGKGGKIVYEIAIKPVGAGEDVTMQVEDDITVRLPKLARGVSIFFADENGVLTRKDPRQRELQLTTVPEQAPQEIVQVG
jgi:hypothetical protein